MLLMKKFKYIPNAAPTTIIAIERERSSTLKLEIAFKSRID